MEQPLNQKERQKFQMLKDGFKSVNNSLRGFAKKLNIDIPEIKDEVISGVTPEHQMFQVTKKGFETIAKTIAKIDIRQPEDGHTPTDSELLALIKPLIPKIRQPEDGKPGHTPTDSELLALIKPLIPKVKDGETPSDQRLLALIKPLIKEPKEIDTKKITDKASEQAIKETIKYIPKLGPEIRDSLEKLEDDNRLDKKAIRGLKEIEDRIDNIKPTTVVQQIIRGGSDDVDILDEKVKLSASDTTADYLNSKISVSGGLTKSTINPGGNEVLNIEGPDLSGLIPKTQNDLTKEPTGFTEPENVIINYDPTTQKITLTGTVGAYYQGEVVTALTSGWVSDAHPNTTGHTYFLYHNGTTFAWSTDSFPGFDKIQIATVNYGATTKYANRECHGVIQWQAHKEFHETIGTYKTAGGTFPSASYVLNSTTAVNRRLDVDSTTINDEDLATVLPALTSKLYTQYSLTGASIGSYTTGASDIIPLSVNNPYYNTFSTPNWGQTLMPANSVATVWIFAVPVTASVTSQAYRYLFIQPQWVTQAQGPSAGQIATAVAAEALRNPSELNLGSLTVETPELVCIGRVIIDFTTNWRLQAVTILTGNKYSQIGSPSGNFLSTVNIDGTLTGNGTAGSPLGVNCFISRTPTYNLDGTLASLTYSNGNTKVFTYNVDGTIATKVYTIAGVIHTTTYTWVAGVLTDIIES